MFQNVLFSFRSRLDWIVPVASDVHKASCTVCCTVLRAHYQDLIVHAQSLKHQQCLRRIGLPVISFPNNANIKSK